MTDGRRVLRIDFGRLRKAKRTAAGGVRVPGAVSRSGVLQYVNSDGTTVREYVPPEELADAESIESLRDAVVTVSHPDGGTRLVSPDTYRTDSVGHVSGEPQVDADHLIADLAVLDADAIIAIDRGELCEISAGYHCFVEETPGVAPNGDPYDRIQRRRSYNHVALLPQGGGRAGSTVALRLDAADKDADLAVQVRADGVDTYPRRHMETERIDGVDYKVGSPEWRQALAKKYSRIDEENAELKDEKASMDSDLETLKAERDSLKEKLAALEAQISEMSDETKMDARVAARLELFERARRVLGSEAKLDGKASSAIVDEVLAKAGVNVEGKSTEYKRARFDFATEKENLRTPLVHARGDAFNGVNQSDDDWEVIDFGATA